MDPSEFTNLLSNEGSQKRRAYDAEKIWSAALNTYTKKRKGLDYLFYNVASGLVGAAKEAESLLAERLCAVTRRCERGRRISLESGLEKGRL